MSFAPRDNEDPPIIREDEPTSERPRVTELLIREEKRRSEDEREVLREIGRKYSPLGVEPPTRNHGK